MSVTTPIVPDLTAATDVAKKAMVPLQAGGGSTPTPPPTTGQIWPRSGATAP